MPWKGSGGGVPGGGCSGAWTATDGAPTGSWPALEDEGRRRMQGGVARRGAGGGAVWLGAAMLSTASGCFSLQQRGIQGVGGGGGGEAEQGCIGREAASEAAPVAVRQAVRGGCQSGWGRLLSVTNAIKAGTWRQGDSGWA